MRRLKFGDGLSIYENIAELLRDDDIDYEIKMINTVYEHYK